MSSYLKREVQIREEKESRDENKSPDGGRHAHTFETAAANVDGNVGDGQDQSQPTSSPFEPVPRYEHIPIEVCAVPTRLPSRLVVGHSRLAATHAAVGLVRPAAEIHLSIDNW